MGDKGASSPGVVTTTETTAAPVATPKKAPVVKSKKAHVKPAHPKTAEMVNVAVKELKERGGSSLQAIKKYMVSTYKIDSAKQATFIKKYLKAAVASGTLIQTKGKGAAGSFKLAAKVDTAKPAAKAKSPKKISPATKKASIVSKRSDASITKAPTKKATTTTAAVGQKKKVAKGPGAKPPKAKTIKAKPATKLPSKKVQPAATNKSKAVAAKPKKVASKKATATAK